MSGAAIQLWWQVQEFLHREADLLDDRRFDEWLDLLDESIRYRAPIARNLKRASAEAEYTAEGEIAWFDEGKATLRQRVRQIQSGYHWIEEPMARVSHLVTNIRIVAAEPGVERPDRVTVRSRFLLYLNRQQTETVTLVGKRLDTLVRAGDDWRIAAREIHLDQSVLSTKALSMFL